MQAHVNEIAYIKNSHQSHKSYRKYKLRIGQTLTSEYKVPRSSKHPLSTGCTLCVPHFKPKNQYAMSECPDWVNATFRSQNRCVQSGEWKNPQSKSVFRSGTRNNPQ
jgi:hypothetical protein